ncbi:MAG: DNA-binding protein [Flavobacteriia bacterium]|nr:DNA-binding protein [Flavobacteriia bacterium]
MKNEIVIYQADSSAERIDVQIDAGRETIWLSQKQMGVLFGKDTDTIGLHLKNIFHEQEINEALTTEFFSVIQKEGKRNVKRNIKHYNLDAILSVGYRVNSKRGTQFRQWATQRLKDYLLKGYAINNRITRLENKLEGLTNKVEEMDIQINTKALPTQGVFFDGQIFDAYELTSRIIRSAQESITLIDNYLDESTFSLLAKKREHVVVTLLTKTPLNDEHKASKQLALDLKKANEQYGNFTVKSFTKSHDRFLVIDQNEVYHLGASLKDLGKKWFAFTKLNRQSVNEMLRVI